MTIQFPKIFKPSSVPTFLNNTSVVFGMENKMTPNVILDMSKIKMTSLLGILLGYKVIEYTYHNYCFEKPLIHLGNKGYIEKQWKKYGFEKLISAYIDKNDKTLKRYKNLEIKFEDSFLIAPQALLRGNDYTKNTLKTKFLPALENYYKNDKKVVQMVFQSLSEILLNFWEHAVEDTRSILVAEGNKHSVEIACADTGNGIISTLKSAHHIKEQNAVKLLESSVKKNVTSKLMSNHMGFGLYLLDQLTTLTKGNLQLFSEGAYYQNNRGKIKSGSCGYWKGTIIYLSLPLNNPKTLADLKDSNDQKLDKLKINWK